MTTAINCSECGDKVMMRNTKSHMIADHRREGWADCVKCGGCEYKMIGMQCLRFHGRQRHVYNFLQLEPFGIPVDIQRS